MRPSETFQEIIRFANRRPILFDHSVLLRWFPQVKDVDTLTKDDLEGLISSYAAMGQAVKGSDVHFSDPSYAQYQAITRKYMSLRGANTTNWRFAAAAGFIKQRDQTMGYFQQWNDRVRTDHQRLAPRIKQELERLHVPPSGFKDEPILVDQQREVMANFIARSLSGPAIMVSAYCEHPHMLNAWFDSSRALEFVRNYGEDAKLPTLLFLTEKNDGAFRVYNARSKR